jgi:hypothetical protein
MLASIATREPDRVNEAAALREPSFQLEGDKSAASGHLAPDDMSLGEIREARVMNGSHLEWAESISATAKAVRECCAMRSSSVFKPGRIRKAESGPRRRP